MVVKLKWPLLIIAAFAVLGVTYTQFFNAPQTFSQTQTIEEKVKSGDFIEHQGHLYINNSNGETVIYDLVNPDEPAEVFRLSQTKEKVHVFDNWLLLESAATDALMIYDVSAPSNPIKKAEFNEENMRGGVSFFDNNIWWKGALIDLNNMSEPSLTPVFVPPFRYAGTFSQESDSLANTIIDDISCGRPGCFGSYIHQVIDISDISDPTVVLSKTVDASGPTYLHVVNRNNGIFAYTEAFDSATERNGFEVATYEYLADGSLELKNQYSNIVNTFPAHEIGEYFYIHSYSDESQSGWYRYDSPFALPGLGSDGMGVASFDHALDNGSVLVPNRVGYFGYPPPESELSTTFTFRNPPPTMCRIGHKDFDGALNATLLENGHIFNVLDLGIGHKVLSISQVSNSNNLTTRSTLPLFKGVTEKVGTNGNMGRMSLVVKDNEHLYLQYRNVLLVTVNISDIDNPQITNYFLTRELDEEEQAFFDPILASFDLRTAERKRILSFLFAPIMSSGQTLLFENNFETEESNSGTLNLYYNCDDESNGCFEQIDAGLNGAAAYFDGEQHHLELREIQDWWIRDLPTPLEEFAEPFTVSAWLKPESTDGLRNIVSRGYNLTPEHEIIFRIQDGSYEFGLWDGNSQDQLATYPVPDSNSEEWGHLVGVFTGAAWNLYFNGKLVDSTTDNADAMTCNSATWAIGRSGNFEKRYYHGYMDEVKFFSGAMSDRQVQQLYETR